MDKDKETSSAFPSFPLEEQIDEINNIFNSNKPLTIGGWFTFNDDQVQFREIKTSWWHNLLAKIWLRWTGWKFKYVNYDEFRRITDEQNKDSH